MGKCKRLVIPLLLFLVACNTVHINEPSQTIYPTNTLAVRINATSTMSPSDSIPAFTVTPILLTPSPWPTMPFIITPNADQVARWREYERALAKVLIPSPKADKTLCEWIILGQSAHKVYVWALCEMSGQIPASTSAPAVIYLEPGGAVQKVKCPRDAPFYLVDVKRLFPPDVQEKIFNRRKWLDVGKMETHIHFRQEHPEEPPLCILSAISPP